MADIAMAGMTRDAQEPSALEAVSEIPLFRTIGYCAGCGTWDEHGPVCVSCGYDFTGEDGVGANL